MRLLASGDPAVSRDSASSQMPKTTYIHPLLDIETALKSVLEQADAPLFALSRSGDVLLLNWRMQAITGFSAAQALQERLLDHTVTAEERGRILEHVQLLLDGEEQLPDPVSWTFTGPGDKQRAITFHALALSDSTGEGIGALFLGRVPSRASAPAPAPGPVLPEAVGEQDENITSLAFRIEVASGRILSMNAASSYLLGYDPQDFTSDSKLLSARVLSEYHESFQAALEDARRGVARSIEVGLARRDNRTVILAMMLYPGRNREREVVSVEGIGRDITARKEAEQQLAVSLDELQAAYDRLQAQHEELQSLDRLKSQVLANVSHELRTPLVTIRGYNELMLQGEMGALTERQLKGLEISAKSIQRLLTLIENLIDFARLEKDRFRLPRETVDVGGLLAEAVSEAADAMSAKDLKVSLDLPNVPAVVSGDRGRLKQAFRNLLDNAEKFCEPGGTVRLEVSRDQGFVCACISDTGIGIPPQEQDRIFETFYQVDGSTTRPYPGLGIGLAIVKEIIELHGGRIEVSSEVGTGSRFRVTLPEELAPQTQQAAAPGRVEDAGDFPDPDEDPTRDYAGVLAGKTAAELVSGAGDPRRRGPQGEGPARQDTATEGVADADEATATEGVADADEATATEGVADADEAAATEGVADADDATDADDAAGGHAPADEQDPDEDAP